ncbi:hypothetical protein Taro_041356 [Colocasia esculenta]|uniref:Uncharacterized protein n=1 Tax=Colocasia esculenta TaxID=4460 RepID=A0A843WFL1_COLES|nr:hypothetical protein [Colocasia esculenta]
MLCVPGQAEHGGAASGLPRARGGRRAGAELSDRTAEWRASKRSAEVTAGSTQIRLQTDDLNRESSVGVRRERRGRRPCTGEQGRRHTNQQGRRRCSTRPGAIASGRGERRRRAGEPTRGELTSGQAGSSCSDKSSRAAEAQAQTQQSSRGGVHSDGRRLTCFDTTVETRRGGGDSSARQLRRLRPSLPPSDSSRRRPASLSFRRCHVDSRTCRAVLRILSHCAELETCAPLSPPRSSSLLQGPDGAAALGGSPGEDGCGLGEGRNGDGREGCGKAVDRDAPVDGIQSHGKGNSCKFSHDIIPDTKSTEIGDPKLKSLGYSQRMGRRSICIGIGRHALASGLSI